MKKHLKQVSVRPHVLVRLLDYLIGQNHPVFHGKGSAAELQEMMRRVIGVEYPETELEKPEDEREGHVPASILSLLEDPERGDEEGDAEHKPQKRLRICNDKNATPGDGARSLDKCLEDIRPHAMCIDRSTKSASDPATQSEGALQNWGELVAQTGNQMIPQFESSYFSEALPFVFPHVCGGPDFFMHKRTRRPPDAPQVGFQEWVAGMARRAESQFRNDWTALPMMRHVLTVWQSEHTLSTLSVHEGGAGSALQADASEYVLALRKLYEVLHNGSVGTGLRAWEALGHRMGMNGGAFLELRVVYRRAHFFFRHKLAEVMGPVGVKALHPSGNKCPGFLFGHLWIRRASSFCTSDGLQRI